jgi:hypothetical protein
MLDINTMSIDELKAALKAAQTAAKHKNLTHNGLTLRVSAKGAVSVYGLGRWPVTLYSTQFTTLLDAKDDILAFIADNVGKLATKKTAAEELAPASDIQSPVIEVITEFVQS